MSEYASDMIVRNLTDALNRLHDDLERVELWAAALSSFQQQPPEYGPSGKYILPRREPTEKAAYSDDNPPHF